tara:strand:+ start:202 stop:555 length:354 start_codon:yes stop_codon:yes gene_type:complete
MAFQFAPLAPLVYTAVARKIGVKGVKELMKKGKSLLSALDPEEIVSLVQEYTSPNKEVNPQIKKVIKGFDKEKPKLPPPYTKIDKSSKKKKKLSPPYTKVYAYGGRVARYKKDNARR